MKMWIHNPQLIYVKKKVLCFGSSIVQIEISGIDYANGCGDFYRPVRQSIFM